MQCHTLQSLQPPKLLDLELDSELDPVLNSALNWTLGCLFRLKAALLSLVPISLRIFDIKRSIHAF